MGYNYGKEYAKWCLWKEKEEKLLRKLGVEDYVILQLREYDWKVFKSERSYRTRQSPTLETFFLNTPYIHNKEVYTVDDLLNIISDELLFQQLSKIDKKTLTILLLKILGYSTDEIASRLNLSKNAIKCRINYICLFDYLFISS